MAKNDDPSYTPGYKTRALKAIKDIFGQPTAEPQQLDVTPTRKPLEQFLHEVGRSHYQPAYRDQSEQTIFDDGSLNRQNYRALLNRTDGMYDLNCAGTTFEGINREYFSLGERADLQNACFIDCNLPGLQAPYACVAGTNIQNSSLKEADLREITSYTTNENGVVINTPFKINGMTQFIGSSLASLQDANLSGAIIPQAQISYVDLTGADLRRALLQESTLKIVKFNAARLEKVNLYAAKMHGSLTFRHADVSEGDLQKLECIPTKELWDGDSGTIVVSKEAIHYPDFSRAKMQQALFDGANLTNSKFNSADLTGAMLRSVAAQKAWFTRAILNGANLSLSNFEHVDFTQAQLADVQAYGTNFTRAAFGGAHLEGVKWYDAFAAFSLPFGKKLQDLTSQEIEKLSAITDVTSAYFVLAYLGQPYGLERCKGIESATFRKTRAHTHASIAAIVSTLAEYSPSTFTISKQEPTDPRSAEIPTDQVARISQLMALHIAGDVRATQALEEEIVSLDSGEIDQVTDPSGTYEQRPTDEIVDQSALDIKPTDVAPFVEKLAVVQAGREHDLTLKPTDDIPKIDSGVINYLEDAYQAGIAANKPTEKTKPVKSTSYPTVPYNPQDLHNLLNQQNASGAFPVTDDPHSRETLGYMTLSDVVDDNGQAPPRTITPEDIAKVQLSRELAVIEAELRSQGQYLQADEVRQQYYALLDSLEDQPVTQRQYGTVRIAGLPLAERVDLEMQTTIQVNGKSTEEE